MLASFLELDAGPSDKILDRLRNNHLAGCSARLYPLTDMHRYTGDFLADDLTFARMKARADLDSELTNRVADRSRGANRSGRAVERQEEASTRGVNLMSSKPC